MRIFILLFTILIFNSAFAQRKNELIEVDSIIQSYNKPNAPMIYRNYRKRKTDLL